MVEAAILDRMEIPGEVPAGFLPRRGGRPSKKPRAVTAREIQKAERQTRKWWTEVCAGTLDPWEFAKRVKRLERKLGATSAPEGLARLAEKFAERDAHREAVAYYERALAEAPGERVWIVNLSASLGALDEDVRALEVLNQVPPKHADHPKVLNNRGAALCTLGRHGEAIGPLARAVEQEPGYVHARLNLARALYRLKRYDEAIEVLEGILSEDTSVLHAWWYKGDCLAEKGDRGAALEAYFRIETEAGADLARAGVVLSMVGLNCQERGDLDAALSFLRRAVALGANGATKEAIREIEERFRAAGGLPRFNDSIPIDIPTHVNVTDWHSFEAFLLGGDEP